MPVKGFSSLPDDIVLVIVALLAPRDQSRELYATTVSRIESIPDIGSWSVGQKHPLVPLSMTCARLRELCMPVMFKLLVIDEAIKRQSMPPNVLAQYREIHLLGSWLQDHQKLEAILLAAKNVRELMHYGSEYDPLPAFIFTHPTVTDVTLHDPPVRANSPVFPASRSLRAFRMLFGSTKWTRTSRLSVKDLQAEGDFILSQIVPSRLSLEELILPMETTNLVALAQAPWPSLLELTLDGEYPEDVTGGRLLDVLMQLPRLRVLVLAIAPRRDKPPLYIWPPGTFLTAPPSLGHLVRVSLSFPRHDDIIFSHLPAGIVELALRDSPRAYRLSVMCRFGLGDATRGGYAASRPLLTCEGAAQLFTILPVLPSLERLELVVQAGPADFDAAEATMYARAASACPNLRILELHRYRAAEARTVPVAAIVEAIAAFSSLRHLRLNLDFPQIGVFTGGLRDIRFLVNSGKMAPIYADAAQLAATAMPWLEAIAFLELSQIGLFGWTTWAVRSSSGDDSVLPEKSNRYPEGDMSWI